MIAKSAADTIQYFHLLFTAQPYLTRASIKAVFRRASSKSLDIRGITHKDA